MRLRKVSQEDKESAIEKVGKKRSWRLLLIMALKLLSGSLCLFEVSQTFESMHLFASPKPGSSLSIFQFDSFMLLNVQTLYTGRAKCSCEVVKNIMKGRKELPLSSLCCDTKISAYPVAFEHQRRVTKSVVDSLNHHRTRIPLNLHLHGSDLAVV